MRALQGALRGCPAVGLGRALFGRGDERKTHRKRENVRETGGLVPVAMEIWAFKGDRGVLAKGESGVATRGGEQRAFAHLACRVWGPLPVGPVVDLGGGGGYGTRFFPPR